MENNSIMSFITINGIVVTEKMMEKIISISSREYHGIKSFYTKDSIQPVKNLLFDISRNVFYQSDDKSICIGYLIKRNEKICFVDQRSHMKAGGAGCFPLN